MVAMNVLITGISGVDGAILAERLVNKGCTVFGVSRQTGGALKKIRDELPNVKAIYSSDLADLASTQDLISNLNLDVIFHLSGQSSVGLSFEAPERAYTSMLFPIINLLEAVRNVSPKTRLVHASSSECFGNFGSVAEGTPFAPLSPYAVAKTNCSLIVRNYRETYNLNVLNVFMFGHESFRRNRNFFIPKLIYNALEVAAGNQEKISLGRLDLVRDVGWAGEFMDAMALVGLTDFTKDIVVGTGEPVSLKDLVDVVLQRLDLDPEECITLDRRFVRSNEIVRSVADPSLLMNRFGWSPEIIGKKVAIELLQNARKTHQTTFR